MQHDDLDGRELHSITRQTRFTRLVRFTHLLTEEVVDPSTIGLDELLMCGKFEL
jgi:hypothetical protein